MNMPRQLSKLDTVLQKLKEIVTANILHMIVVCVMRKRKPKSIYYLQIYIKKK